MKNINEIIDSYPSDFIKNFELDNGSIDRKMFNEEKVRAMLFEYASQFERPDNDSGQGWSTEQLIEKVKQFYKEKELNPKSELSGEIVCSRLVLFTEWLNGSKEETWEDILNAQPK